jgi:hypothetical protein
LKEKNMKNITLRSTIILASLFVMLSTGALAQRSQSLYAEVPFDFYLKGKKVPAGEYTIERVNQDSNQAIMILKRRSDGSSVAVITCLLSTARTSDDTAGASLLFDRIASTYFLAGIENSAGNYSARFPRSKAAIRDIGQMTGKPETVTVSLRR